MTSSLRRAAAFASVASLSLAAPALGRIVVVPFGFIAVAAFATRSGPLFELFALPADRRRGRLVGLMSFALGVTGVAILTVATDLPVSVFVATVLLVGYGELGAQTARRLGAGDLLAVTGYLGVGLLAGAVGQLAVGALATEVTPQLPIVVFLAAAGSTFAALLRSILATREDPVVLVSVALFLWVFSEIGVTVDTQGIALALAVTVGLGYVSWGLGTASIPGMLTGVLLSLLTVVLGGYGWFTILVAFFAIGGLAAKFQYEHKANRGVAEPRGGARGTANVLGNAAPALIAVVLFAAKGPLGVPGALFLFAFTGSLATALGDTLSSEIGGLYDNPRLITTFEVVSPGTDGGVTWQGELAGIGGATVIAGLAWILFGLSTFGTVSIVGAGLAGMTVDSLLGATLEGTWIGNQAVNFLATAAGALIGVGLVVAGGVVAV